MMKYDKSMIKSMILFDGGFCMKIVGMDIGATNLRIALADEKGNIIKQSTEKTDGPNLMSQIYSKLDELGNFHGIGIASVGPLNSRSGVITNPPNINIRNLNIVDMLKERYDRPSYLLNDCVAIVLGEKRFGVGKKIKNLVYLTLSTGIGCGAIVDDRVILGKDGNAHEVGHYVVETDSRLRCGCGRYGHWEAYCSGKNIPNFARYLLQEEYKDSKTKLSSVKDLTSELLFEIGKTDKVAAGIVEKIGRINAIQIENIIHAYDPELITIGGSVALNNQKEIMGPIQEYLRDYSFSHKPEVIITGLGGDAGVLGGVAGFLYFNEVGL